MHIESSVERKLPKHNRSSFLRKSPLTGSGGEGVAAPLDVEHDVGAVGGGGGGEARAKQCDLGARHATAALHYAPTDAEALHLKKWKIEKWFIVNDISNYVCLLLINQITN